MNLHEKNIQKSIDLNIIGTSNVVKMCEKSKIKLIYFSTGYVYEGTKGNYSETDPVKPFNNYGLSKLGGECAVAMYKNSLILRITMTEKPFPYKKAFSNLKSNFIFQDEIAKILPLLVNEKGVINVGGKSRSVYSFAKKYNPKIIGAKVNKKIKLPLNQTMNLSKLNKIIGRRINFIW
jgi:dTDP-4-dehydrorhamnose reductase